MGEEPDAAFFCYFVARLATAIGFLLCGIQLSANMTTIWNSSLGGGRSIVNKTLQFTPALVSQRVAYSSRAALQKIHHIINS